MSRHLAALSLLLAAAGAGAASASVSSSASAGAVSASVSSSAARPNFVVILTDDVDVLLGGVDGMPRLLSEVRGGGRDFTAAYVTTPICCPSRTALLSGRFGHNLQEKTQGWCGAFTGFPAENATWAAALQDAGYVTAMVGKLHNSPPQHYVPKGWTEFFSLNNECQYFENTFNCDGKTCAYGRAPADYMTSVIGNRSIDFLKRVAGGPAPFLAYIAPHSSHMPATPAPWYANASIPHAGAPRTPAFGASGAGKHWVTAELAPLTPAIVDGIDAIARDRARSLLSVDDIVAAGFDTLRAAGALDNTHVLFTSDHGYDLGTFRLSVEKFHSLENVIRVPFFWRGPGVPANSTSEAIVSQVDIGATLLELAGVAGPPTDGRSFARALTAPAGGPPPPGWRDAMLVEYGSWGTGYIVRGPCSDGCGVCPDGAMNQLLDAPSNTWSAIRVRNASMNALYAEYRPGPDAPVAPSSSNFTEYYDLAADPYQLVNLAPKLPPATRAALSAQLFRYASCVGAECP